MTDESNGKARFYNPPNLLKQKVGSGGLGKDILEKAQRLLEENKIDFKPIAYTYMDALHAGLELAYNPPANVRKEKLLEGLLNPIMQLKANGGMFHYSLVSRISDRMIIFLENLATPDKDAQEIIQAYYTTSTAILQSNLKGDGGKEGENLYLANCEACDRYCRKHR